MFQFSDLKITDISELEFGFFFPERVERGRFFSNFSQLKEFINDTNPLSFHHSIHRFFNPWETTNNKKILKKKNILLDIDLSSSASFLDLKNLYNRILFILDLFEKSTFLPFRYRIYFSGQKGFHVYFDGDYNDSFREVLISFISIFSPSYLLKEVYFKKYQEFIRKLLLPDFQGYTHEELCKSGVFESFFPLDFNCFFDENRLIKSIASPHRKTKLNSLLMPSCPLTDENYFLKAVPPGGLSLVPLDISHEFSLFGVTYSIGKKVVPNYVKEYYLNQT